MASNSCSIEHGGNGQELCKCWWLLVLTLCSAPHRHLQTSGGLFQVVCVQQVLATLSEVEMESTEDTWGSSRNHGKAGGPRSQEATELVWEGHRCCWGRTD